MTRVQLLNALNEALLAAEAHLYALNPGVAAAVEMSDGAALVWERNNGAWRLFVEHGDQTKHVLECSVEQRVLAANALPEMMKELREAAAEDTADIRAAIATAKGFARGDHDKDFTDTENAT